MCTKQVLPIGDVLSGDLDLCNPCSLLVVMYQFRY